MACRRIASLVPISEGALKEDAVAQCPGCGLSVSETARFCPTCGSTVGTASTVLQEPATLGRHGAAPSGMILSTRTLLIVFVATSLLVMAIAGGFAHRERSAPGSAFVGRWRVDQFTSMVLDIRREGDLFVLEVPSDTSGVAPWVQHLRLEKGMLLPIDGESRNYRISREGDETIMTSWWSTDPGCPPEWAVMTPLGPQFSDEDAAVVRNLGNIEIEIRAWAADHDNTLPECDEVNAEMYPPQAFDWPDNPYTGQPMKQGADPGDFTFSGGGTSFCLKGFGGDGQVVVVDRGEIAQ